MSTLIGAEVLTVTSTAAVALDPSKMVLSGGARATRAVVEHISDIGTNAEVVYRFDADPTISPVVGGLLPVRIAGAPSKLVIDGWELMNSVTLISRSADARLYVQYFS